MWKLGFQIGTEVRSLFFKISGKIPTKNKTRLYRGKLAESCLTITSQTSNRLGPISMNTLALDRPIEQEAITNSLGFAQNKLFQSTAKAIEFWLEVLRNKEKLPKKEYSEYLNSFGWSNRDASPYVKMADFVRTNLLNHLDVLARLDIRNVIKLPRIRYISVVEAIKATPLLTNKQVNELIKKLPTKPRGYKSAEQREDEIFEVNVPAATGAVITEAAELLGFTKQKLILLAVELVKAIAVGDDKFADLTEEIQEQIAKKATVDDEELEYAPETENELSGDYENLQGTELAENHLLLPSHPICDTWQEVQLELATYIEDQQPPKLSREEQILADRQKHVNRLTADLQLVNDSITQLVQSGHEDNSLMLIAAQRKKERVVRELNKLTSF